MSNHPGVTWPSPRSIVWYQRCCWIRSARSKARDINLHPMTVLTGGCLCGEVRYEVSEPFASANYCHCTRCQRRTGTASSANAHAPEGSFRITEGEQLVKCWDPGDGGFLKCFCSNCGSALFSRDPETKGSIAVRLGTVDGDPGIRPQQHQFVDYAAVWEPIRDDGLPRFPESSRGH